MSELAISITQLNRQIADTLESEFPLLWVKGEVSNFTAAASGHWYFTVKDARASVRAVMFRGRASSLGFIPRNGDQYELRVKVTLYEPRGDYQLQVETIRRAGQGSLYETFLKLKEKLNEQGYFNEQRKKPLPSWPRQIAVISSLQAAALQDVLSALARRVPHLPILIIPSAVQGADATAQLVTAIEQANDRSDIDVILLVRGGGSIEDLWCFNEESLAMAIANSRIPVVSGVGHETDFTIADFVADLRAPTPTAAAELVSTPRSEYIKAYQYLANRLNTQYLFMIQRLWQRLDRASLRLLAPSQRVQQQRHHLESLTQRLKQCFVSQNLKARYRLELLEQTLQRQLPNVDAQKLAVTHLQNKCQQAMDRRLQDERLRLENSALRLRALSPQHTLDRGYAIVKMLNGHIVQKRSDVDKDQILHIQLSEGNIRTQVLD